MRTQAHPAGTRRHTRGRARRRGARFMAVVWVALFAVYMILPNVRVAPGSALFGAAVSAILWQGALILYVQLQMGVAGYNALYDALREDERAEQLRGNLRRLFPAELGQLLRGLDEETRRSDHNVTLRDLATMARGSDSAQPRIDSESQPQVH